MQLLRPDKRFATALVAVALVLGVGIATYLLGGDGDAGEEGAPQHVDLDLSTITGSSRQRQDVLFLPWGDGPMEASRKGERATRSTIEAVFSSEGYVFVVDHPKDVIGARVRWFSQDGSLTGTVLAPSGSKAFRPHEGGFNYVIAKSGKPSETAVVHPLDGSGETTYVVPLQMNTGGLVHAEDTLYASVAPSQVDFENERLYLRYALIPVAIGGVQVDDASSDAGALDLWGYGLDGKAYTSTMEVLGLDVVTSEVVTLIGSEGRSIRVPRRYRLLGADASSRVYLARVPEEAMHERPVQHAPAWISSAEPFDEVLVMGMDATIESSIVLPYSAIAARYDASLPISLCEDGLYSVRADGEGVTVVRYPSN